MAAHRGEGPGQFMYEPSYPPTIPPGQTIAPTGAAARYGGAAGAEGGGADDRAP
jgi:hypothetical protein